MRGHASKRERGRVLIKVSRRGGRKESGLKYTSNAVATYIAVAIGLTFIAFGCTPPQIDLGLSRVDLGVSPPASEQRGDTLLAFKVAFLRAWP